MDRPALHFLAVALVACFLSAKQTAFAQVQQSPAALPPTGLQTNPLPVIPAATPSVTPQQVGQIPGQLGQPQQAPGQGLPGNAPAPPIQLTPVEKQFVDQILNMWENASAEIATFDCQFERLEYDPVFGPANLPMILSYGHLTYSKPDKGSFKIEKIHRWTKKNANQAAWEPGEWVEQKHEVGEHWVCDGKAIFEYNHREKQLEVNPLPPEMRGKSIVDGPLPFLFGAEAKKLNARYWIRSKQSAADTIWLEAFPRHQADAANYHHVDIMLERKTMMPTALQVHMPNGQSRAVYKFKKPTVNGTLNKLFGGIFSAPRTPFGWKRVVHQLPASAQAAPQASQPQDTKQR